MKACLFLLSLLITSASLAAEIIETAPTGSSDIMEKAHVSGELGMGPRYHYNVYLDFNRAVPDSSFNLTPQIFAQTKPSSFYLVAEFKGLFEKYFSSDIQSHLDYDGSLTLKINETGSKAFTFVAGYQSFTEPSPNESYGKVTHNQLDSWIKSRWRGSEGGYFDANLHLNMETIRTPIVEFNNGNFYDNATYEGILQYNNAFLPETRWIIRGTGGLNQYLNKSIPAITTGVNNSLKVKSDSYYGLLETGLTGKLTEKSTIDCAAGYLFRVYQADDSFSGPVFYLKFNEQVTRRDQLLAGYNYVVKNSYWSNYMLDQEIYIGFARVMGDQLLVMTRIGYMYTSYSKPDRRDDQRIGAAAMLKYSVSSKVKVAADVKFDLLASDAYDNSVSSYMVDRPASYKSGSMGLSLITSF